MKKVEVTCGFKVYDDSGNLLRYQGDWGGEGYIYKDDDAFENHPDEVCYISENSFPDGQDFATVDEALRCGETRNTIREQVRDAYGDDYLFTEYLKDEDGQEREKFLLVFDWAGNLKASARFGNDVFSFVYDEKQNVLYGWNDFRPEEKPYQELYKFDLNGILEK